MASRGARARKVTEKNIHKEEKKNSEKERAERFARLHSPAGNLSASRPFSPTDKSHVAPWNKAATPVQPSSASVTSSGSNGSTFSSVMGSRLSSADERKKYAAKGKTTSHPRGRGGGVPVKVKNLEETRSKSSFSASIEGRSNKSRSHSVSSDHAKPTYEKSWANTKLFIGGGHSPKPYAGFEHDDDMWMADGDCLIFFSEETSEDDPRPMLRVHKGVLEQAKSTFMINLLRYGEIVREDDDTPPSSAGPTPSQSQWPLTTKSLGHLDQVLSESTQRLDLRSPPVSQTTRYNQDRDTWSTSDQTLFSPGDRERSRTGPGGQQAPSSITLQSPAESLYGDQHDDSAVEITHEIWFRAPSHIKRPDIQRRHHMATRNYIALLYGLPIIGNDFYEMLSDLQNVMDTYYELNEPSERWNSAQVIVQYLTQRRLDDVRGSLTNALGLLTWSEQPNVLWDAGYLEAFVHSVGMMTQATMKTKEYRNLSQVTRHKLQMAYNGSQLRLIEAEERLARFDFPEMWYVDGVANNSPIQKSFESFREFLFAFYEEEYGSWPPRSEDHQGHWLSRAVMTRLQADFGAVYNYWVDRDIVWDGNESRSSRKWEMVPKRLRAGGFEADSPGFPITDMLIGFDSSQKYDHIPHPYPLLPETRLPSPKLQSSRKNLLSKFRSKDKEAIPDVKQQYQMALAFNQASNINRLGTTFEDNKLLESISTYEKSATTSTMTPSEARLGRWVLLYGILQVLSTISVDTVGLKYKDKVRYYINPSLEGCPPWRSPDAAPLMIEACQQRSYCWTAPQTWTDSTRRHSGPGAPPGYSNHQYELTEPMNNTPEPEAHSSMSMHRNPSILQTAINASTVTNSSRASSTSRGLLSPESTRGPSLHPVRSPLASPSLISSPLGSALVGFPDEKSDYELSVEQESPMLVPPTRNPRRVSPGPLDRGSAPMSPLTLDAVTSTTPPMSSPVLVDRDDRPPQLGELSFSRSEESFHA
ncbi:uncharacterized protein PV09_06996 [Verruconis gallopava]|uniref:DUF8004 domain-containing protein n=1 Tax=Verruconis gallopava TaxID=253628 RepID=A0A0D2A400_9PEZI|nr:uncharacterized protein PV09_06996 [Verruconis gallopava]KIW01518.1 hypothetical protein PV09_06996 [Verruconis gallopava]